MAAEITMPQLSDTMTEGTLVKWLKKEGEPVKAGDEIAEIETDKATMPMEAFDSGVIAYLAVKEGQKVKVGETLAVIATAGESREEIKKQYASGAKQRPTATAVQAAPEPTSAGPVKLGRPGTGDGTRGASSPAAPPGKSTTKYTYDIVVIGGGPAGYAAAIRAGQLKQRVLCIEKENLGGTCLNWGCIPTKALLDNGAFVRRLREDAAEWGVSFDNLKVDFGKAISRSRAIADKLARGIAHLFRKYEVKHEIGTGQLLGPHRVKLTRKQGSSEVTAGNVILAPGARPRTLPNISFDGKTVISSREAMALTKQPKRMAIIGGGPIGCEFADFYNAMGTEVTIVEFLDHLLPIEDDDVSILLERVFGKRGIKVHTKTAAERVEKTSDGVRLHAKGPGGAVTADADVVLMGVGFTGNLEQLTESGVNLELNKGHIKVDRDYRTNIEDVWAVGDVIGAPWLAHVAHHQAVACVERICGISDHRVDLAWVPGCTYTHPQVARMGLTERLARQEKREIRIGKFPFSVSGRALAAGETDGFVKLIFDSRYGELLGVHMIGENVTELLSELVLAHNLEATEDEIIEAMHPHPTLSEAVMEAAGAAEGRSIHL